MAVLKQFKVSCRTDQEESSVISQNFQFIAKYFIKSSALQGSSRHGHIIPFMNVSNAPIKKIILTLITLVQP